MPPTRRAKAVAGVKAATAAVRSTRKKKEAERKSQEQDEMITLSRKELADLATSIADKITEKRQNTQTQPKDDSQPSSSIQSRDSDEDQLESEDETSNMLITSCKPPGIAYLM